MKEIQKIAQKVLTVLMDILVFTYQIVRKIILPTLRRKGNVLSSLLVFFIGLLEMVVSFEKSVLRRPVVFTHKYVKHGLIIAVGFLFLLSSLEWVVGPSVGPSGNGSTTMVACAPAARSVQKLAPGRFTGAVTTAMGILVAGRYFIPPLFPACAVGLGKVRRWLRFGVFRI
ncbi:MAG: hypothetical protein Q8918_14875 [Bacteroidota bacterium]|nr:hypothetical protein [Bacteroidota bacterium]MDP4211617.1 hypothetical protein [Bacteroidota bacterium]MDP4251386.1 hypothetical protein [Bacteroidota bacterium]